MSQSGAKRPRPDSPKKPGLGRPKKEKFKDVTIADVANANRELGG